MNGPEPADPARRALLDGLWSRFRPLVEQRVAAVEAYAAGTGTLAEASWAAHNLAGSLGSYGRAEAGDLARRIDTLLAGEHDQARVGELAGLLRAAVAEP